MESDLEGEGRDFNTQGGKKLSHMARKNEMKEKRKTSELFFLYVLFVNVTCIS